VRPHRALVRLEVAPYLVQALLLPALFCGLLLRYEPELVAFWREFILAWAEPLGMPLAPSSRPAGWGEVRLAWMYLTADTVLPGRVQLYIATLATAAVFVATFFLPPRRLPLKYLLRILCAVQAAALAFFALAPAPFPYDISDHILAVTGSAYVVLLSIPVMLALGYYVLRLPLARKIAHTALILLYFIVWTPVHVLLHVALVQHLSIVVMPLLYLCFGAMLDVVLFIALYAWVASTAPDRATTPARALRAGTSRA
jgi:uncharacterized membrane protein